MSLMDKIKAGAEQAATKAKQEARELQVKRALGQEEGELGRTAFALVDRGAIAHPELDEHMGRIRELRAELDELAGPPAEAASPSTAQSSEERPRSDVPPATPS